GKITFEVKTTHELFRDSGRVKRSLSEVVVMQRNSATHLRNITEYWESSVQKAIGAKPKRDPKDFVRLRLLCRKLGPEGVVELIDNLVYRHKNNPKALTTLRLYGLGTKRQKRG